MATERDSNARAGRESESDLSREATDAELDPLVARRLLDRLEISSETGDDARPPPSSHALPRRLGRYILEHEIAVGGMGVVFLARDTELDREVAVKLIRAAELATPEEVDRFHDEACTVARLEHPAIVPVYDSGEIDGRAFLALRLLGGGTLEDRLASFLDRPREIATLLRTISAAVEHAHRAGVLHRDLKPSNILFDDDDRPSVCDFGLARDLRRWGERTRSGALLGTAPYMAPEQIDHELAPLSAATDVYGLGALLYELLTARPPFVGTNPSEVLRGVMERDPPRPSSIARGVDRDLETICLRCLEKRPAKRYARAQDVVDELERFLAGRSIAARRAGVTARVWKWCRRRPHRAALVALAFAVAIGVPALAISYHRRLGERAEEAEAREFIAQHRTYAARLHLAFRDRDDGFTRRARERLASLVPATGETDLRGFAWRHLAHLMEAEVHLLAPDRERVIDLHFSPDGARLDEVRGDGSHRVWDPRSGDCLNRSPAIGHEMKHAFADQGRVSFLAHGSRRFDEHDSEVRAVWSVGGPGERRQRWLGFRAGSLGVSPDDGWLVSGGDGQLVLWRRGETPDALQRVAASEPGPPRFHTVAVCDGARWILTSDLVGVVEVWRRVGDRLEAEARLCEGESVAFPVSFDPMGTRVALPRRASGVEIWRAPGDEGGAWKLDSKLTVAGDVSAARFGPRGRLLALAYRPHRGGAKVQIRDLETRQLLRELLGHDGDIATLEFRDDGRWLATGDAEGETRVWDLTEPALPARREGPEIYHDLRLASPSRVVAVRRHFVLEVFSIERAGRWRELRSLATFAQEKPATAEALSENGRLVARALKDGRVELHRLDVESEQPARVSLGVLDAPGGEITELSFLSGDRRLLVAFADGRVLLFRRDRESATGHWTREMTLDTGDGDIDDVALDPAGTTLAIARRDRGDVEIWDLPLRTRRAVLRAHGDWVIVLAFSSDGASLVTGGVEGDLRVWDLRGDTPEVRLWLRGHAKGVTGAAFLDDGRVLASTSDDRTMKIWDLTTGEERAALLSGSGPIDALVVAPDESFLITAGGLKKRFGELIVWEAPRVEAEDPAQAPVDATAGVSKAEWAAAASRGVGGDGPWTRKKTGRWR